MRYLFLLLLLAACTTYVQTQGEDPLNASYQDLHRYESVREYAYRATIANLTVEVVTTVEPADGRWKLTNTLGNYTSVMYVSMEDERCLAVSDGSCPEQGVNSARAAASTPVFAGQEHLTVPAGTFSTREYVVNEDSYWVSPAVPVPVRYEGELFVMDLLYWT